MNPFYRLTTRRNGGHLAQTRARWLLPLGVVAALVLGSCDRNQQQPAPTASATSAASPTASPSNPTDGAPTAMDAYRGMWKAYIDAIRIPDPAYPDLARYAQGDALKVFVNGLTSVQRDGLVGQGDVTLNPQVTGVNPNASPPTVEIKDCVDTSKSHLVKKDGSPYQDTPGGRRSASATVTRVGEGVWKVTSLAVFGVGSC